MMIRKLILLLGIPILLGVALANCNPYRFGGRKPSLIHSTKTPLRSSPTPTKALRPTYTPTIPPPHFVPTILPNQEQRMASLLHQNDCELPCYLGITPGKTSWGEARKILESVGAYSLEESPKGEFTEYGMTIFGYEADIGDPLMANVTPNPNAGVGDRKITQYLRFTIGNNIVQRIYVSTHTTRFVKKFHQYWSRYTLDEIFKRIGQPEKIYFGISKWGSGYSMIIVYEHISAVINLNGVKKNTSICPLMTIENERSIYREMTLTNKDMLPDIFAPGKVLPTDRNVYLPIEEALGINVKEFYTRLQSDPSACFEINRTVE